MRQLFMRRADLEGLPEMPVLPAGYALRQATVEDAAAVAAVMQSAEDLPWTAERARNDLLDRPELVRAFVVTADGTPVANASALRMPKYPGSGYVHWVAAHREHRGRRLGYVVTLAVLQCFREIGCRDAVLETDRTRFPAIHTYLALGFRPEMVDPEHEAIWQAIYAELGIDGIGSS